MREQNSRQPIYTGSKKEIIDFRSETPDFGISQTQVGSTYHGNVGKHGGGENPKIAANAPCDGY